jgi:hypothetical protein
MELNAPEGRGAGGAASGATTAVEVAPGLVMERETSAEPDGRYLLYYRFRRAGGRIDDDDRPARP